MVQSEAVVWGMGATAHRGAAGLDVVLRRGAAFSEAAVSDLVQPGTVWRSEAAELSRIDCSLVRLSEAAGSSRVPYREAASGQVERYCFAEAEFGWI